MDDIFDTILGGFNPIKEITPSMTHWLHTFTTRGSLEITKRLLAGDPCEHPHCATRYYAGVRCITCKRVVCLGHAALFADGQGICFTCSGRKEREPEAPPQRPQNARAATEAALIHAAYTTLGLEPGATKAEVHRAHKVLRRDHHPDKAGLSPADKRRATERSKLIGQAYAVVCKARGW